MDHGLYKAEGLDASWVELTGRALVTAGLSGNADFIPIPSGGAQAALSGAKIKYVVGQSLRSQWTIVVPKTINKPEDLRGKTIGYGRQGSADYDEGAAVLLRAFNMHPYKGHVQHIDFQRVSKDKKIHMKVPLHFVNAEKSPGVKEMGGVSNHVLNDLDVTCFPDDLPEFIEVDLGELKVGDSVHIKDLKLPKGVEPVLHRGENPVVATVILPALITEEEETAAAEAVPAPSEVPTTAQAQPEAAAEGAAGDKAAAKPAGDKGDKGDKGEKKEKK